MPKTDKGGIEAKNSNLTTSTPPVIPTVEPTVHYQTLHPRALRRAKFTAEPQTYAVEITGTEREYGKSELLASDIRWQEIFHEYHPCLAIGRAVIAFLCANAIRTIKDVRISRCVIK